MDYALPHADGFTGFKTEFDTSIPCLTNPLGAKGVGELGTIGATPAVVNAVIDALDHAGLGAAAEQVQMPLTAERVWRAVNLRGVRSVAVHGVALCDTQETGGVGAGKSARARQAHKAKRLAQGKTLNRGLPHPHEFRKTGWGPGPISGRSNASVAS